MKILTDEELEAVHDLLYDEYFYGRELIYQETEEANNISSAMEKIRAELKERAKR